MKKILLSVAAIALLFAACNKEDKNDTKTRTEYLTSGNWYVHSDKDIQTAPTDTTYDYIADSSYAPCDLDDFIKFNTDGTVVFDEGASKCSSLDPQSFSASWEFINNEQDIAVTFGDSTSTIKDTFHVSALDDNTFSMNSPYEYTSGGVTYKGDNITTYKHEPLQ